jgi:hypothetical protein
MPFFPGGGGGGSSSGGVTETVTQTGHGFAVGDVVRWSGTEFVKAQADSAANADVVGIVASVTSADIFVLGLTDYLIPSGLVGLTPGAAYFLSAATPGLMTATAPTTIGQIRKPVAIAKTATSAWVQVLLGVEIPAATVAHAHGQMVIPYGSPSVISLVTPGTPVKITGFTAGPLENFTNSNDQLTYTGLPTTFVFVGTSDLKVDKTCNVLYTLYVNGNPTTNVTPHTFTGIGKVGTISICGLPVLNTGDVLEVYATSVDTANVAMTIETLSIVIHNC